VNATEKQQKPFGLLEENREFTNYMKIESWFISAALFPIFTKPFCVNFKPGMTHKQGYTMMQNGILTRWRLL